MEQNSNTIGGICRSSIGNITGISGDVLSPNMSNIIPLALAQEIKNRSVWSTNTCIIYLPCLLSCISANTIYSDTLILIRRQFIVFFVGFGFGFNCLLN